MRRALKSRLIRERPHKVTKQVVASRQVLMELRYSIWRNLYRYKAEAP